MRGAYSILSNAGETPVDVYLRETNLQESSGRPKSAQISRLELVCAFEMSQGEKTENSYFIGFIDGSQRLNSDTGTRKNHRLHIDELGDEISSVNRNHELTLLKEFFGIMSKADPWITGIGNVMPETHIKTLAGRDYDGPARQALRSGYRQFQQEYDAMQKRFWRRPLFSVLEVARQY